ncbi:hypothetical protein L2E82_06271 [Cichorium intybus]|uniref:Uncharacterized protein n=1 Tax=Cichorium intybus TaxID=13427 RepID=A0ACB9H9M4_CICIN|nr:hypothetical protein L2E82_06271 [Cichorium intybus]
MLKSTATTVISLLKQSLSVAFHHFHPLAGNISAPPSPAEPHIIYNKGDSVSLTIAESSTNIINLSGNHPRKVVNLYSLLLILPIPSMIDRTIRTIASSSSTIFG